MNLGHIYLGGPMTGLPEDNYPAFNAEAARLRALGYQVTNPAELPHPPNSTWPQFMRRDLKAMLDCDTLALLPDYMTSRGAAREIAVAVDVDMTLIMAHEITQPCQKEEHPE